MRKILPAIILIGVFSGAFLMNCVVAQSGHPGMTFYVNYGASSTSAVRYDSSDREGKACAYSFVALFAFGNASVEAAAGKANIKSISSVSHVSEFQMFIFQKWCTIVRGK